MKPNILFLLIDTFRADKFSGKGKTSKTPNLDSLITNGAYFDQAISCGDGTILYWSGLFTGLHPFKTGIKSQGYKKIDSNIKSYFSILENEEFENLKNNPNYLCQNLDFYNKTLLQNKIPDHKDLIEKKSICQFS